MTYCVQTGFPKSGNFLLYTILREILTESKLFSSYRATCILPKKIEAYITTFQGREVDSVLLIENALHLVVPHPQVKTLLIDDLPNFKRKASIVWTHQEPSQEYLNIFPPTSRWFYIYRDGRDVINSLFHYVVNPKVLRRNKEYMISNADELFQNYDYFAKHVKKWKKHIEAGQHLSTEMTWVRFEELISSKERVLESIGQAMKLPINISKVIKKTQPQYMAKYSPDHVRKALAGDWKNHFNQHHKQIFKDTAGRILIDLGYESNMDW